MDSDDFHLMRRDESEGVEQVRQTIEPTSEITREVFAHYQHLEQSDADITSKQMQQDITLKQKELDRQIQQEDKIREQIRNLMINMKLFKLKNRKDCLD